ncbi:hypothetical protein [Pectinatus frisingensis]|uniref:hypothetical protein n=1 Tax=Pectinatus frisingensis TaxID=865 RepID=UPI0018C54676|nr:hypothetical protein [Pectinatus frisingensis]
MNGKKRWQISIAISLLLHLIILLFAAYQIALWLPAQQAEEQEDPVVTEVYMDEDTSSEDESASDDAGSTSSQNNSTVSLPSEAAVTISQQPPTDAGNLQDTAENDNPAGTQNNKSDKNRPHRNRTLTTDTRNKDLSQFGYEKPPVVINKTNRVKLPDSVLPVEGSIAVEVLYQAAPDGTVSANIPKSKSSGNEDIDDALIEAVNQWRFEPRKTASPVMIANFICHPGDDTLFLVQ